MAESKATSAHTEQPGGHTGVFPPFDKTTYASQLFWLVICFVALYLLIARTAVPRISGILEQRTKRIENDFAEAQRDKEQSEAALVAYEKALADARTRAQAIGTEIREKVHVRARYGFVIAARRGVDDAVALVEPRDAGAQTLQRVLPPVSAHVP